MVLESKIVVALFLQVQEIQNMRTFTRKKLQM